MSDSPENPMELHLVRESVGKEEEEVKKTITSCEKRHSKEMQGSFAFIRVQSYKIRQSIWFQLFIRIFGSYTHSFNRKQDVG